MWPGVRWAGLPKAKPAATPGSGATQRRRLNALCGKLLAAGRRKADNNSRMFAYRQAHPAAKPADLVMACAVSIHAARAALPRYRAGRVPASLPPGLAPKTVVNAHRMLHRS
jgi:hypothetical protein